MGGGGSVLKFTTLKCFELQLESENTIHYSDFESTKQLYSLQQKHIILYNENILVERTCSEVDVMFVCEVDHIHCTRLLYRGKLS